MKKDPYAKGMPTVISQQTVKRRPDLYPLLEAAHKDLQENGEKTRADLGF
jgi:hypothetical protein